MKILSVDVGTGTQDIFLYDSQLHIENGFKLVVPSPTMIVHRQVKAATQAQEPILLTGVMMGGGPSAWAVEAHARAGLPVFATPGAANTLNDELEVVQDSGIEIVSGEEAIALPETVQRIEFRDFNLPAIQAALLGTVRVHWARSFDPGTRSRRNGQTGLHRPDPRHGLGGHRRQKP